MLAVLGYVDSKTKYLLF